MKNKIFIITLFVLLVSTATHCFINKEHYRQLADATPLMLERAKDLSDILETQKGLRTGAYLYSSTINMYENNLEKLAVRLHLLGITDVYTSFPYKEDEDQQFLNFKKLVWEFDKYKIKVYARGIESGHFFVSDEGIYSICNRIEEYNQKVNVNERIIGISADLEPHMMKAGRSIVPKELTWIWDGEKGWGIGNDNDRGLKRTVEVMQLAKNTLPAGLKLNEAINVGWQRRYNEGGLLEWGSAHQFLEHCDYLIAMAYSNQAETIFSMSEPILSNAKDLKKSVSIAVKTKKPRDIEDQYSISTSLEPAGWDNMLNSLEYVIKKAKEYPSFRGIDFFEFASLEEMWQSE